MKSNFTSREQGFTLVELMIVVAIIGILAAIAIPNYQQYQAKARQGEAKIALSGIHTALQSFAAEQSSFTGCLTGAGFGLNGANKRYYVLGFSMAAADADLCGPTGAFDCNASGWIADGTGMFAGTACAASVEGAFGAADGPNVFNANATTAPGTMVAEADLTALAVASVPASVMAPTATAASNTGFVAGAAGSVSAMGVDTWSIDQNKNLLNSNIGL